ncbi:MAG: ATP-dependent protease ATPase subunit HslU, partial [Acidobacteria bacterium]
IIEIEIQDRSTPVIDVVGIGGQGIEEMGFSFNDILGNLFPKKTKRRKLRIAEAREYLIREEQANLVDMDTIIRTAIEKTQNSGIIFLDEIDKIAGRETHGPDVSREGVQRDLLPIVEGTNVNTRYGMVNTEHILFIAAGAFHVSKPTDLIPELQGRFPIRVELDPLTKDDFKRILTEPKNSLIKQYQALLSTEGISLTFTEDAIDAIAEIAVLLNQNTENIGARRLHTIMEKLLEDISFEGAELAIKEQIVDKQFVERKLEMIVSNNRLSSYIL